MKLFARSSKVKEATRKINIEITCPARASMDDVSWFVSEFFASEHVTVEGRPRNDTMATMDDTDTLCLRLGHDDLGDKS